MRLPSGLYAQLAYACMHMRNFEFDRLRLSAVISIMRMHMIMIMIVTSTRTDAVIIVTRSNACKVAININIYIYIYINYAIGNRCPTPVLFCGAHSTMPFRFPASDRPNHHAYVHVFVVLKYLFSNPDDVMFRF